MNDINPRNYTLIISQIKFDNKDTKLNKLFDYEGKLEIIKSVYIDNNFNKNRFEITKIVDYIEFLQSTPEDLTRKPEAISKTLHYKKVKNLTKPQLKNPIIEDLDGSNAEYFLNNGERYEGKYHLHQSTGQAMTGSKHSDESKNLYIKHYFRNKSSDKLYLANRINRRKNPNFKILVSKQNSVERNN